MYVDIGRQSYSIAAVNEFDPLFDDIYAFCEAQEIEIDTLIHEDGAAQMEINLIHGDALDLADQAFLFKRTAREAALKGPTDPHYSWFEMKKWPFPAGWPNVGTSSAPFTK